MENKFNYLENILKEMESIVIAFSGGVDSTLLAAISYYLLGRNVIAVTVKSSFTRKDELKEALKFTKKLKMRHIVVEVDVLDNKKIKRNDKDRCYYCKKEIIRQLKKIADENRIKNIIDASNYDDLNDYRPGFRAAKEMNIRHPFIEAKITKKDIREHAKKMGLKIWDKPSSACLASRVAYGIELTDDNLTIINECEEFLQQNGFKDVRVRLHNNFVRIEVNIDEIERLASFSKEIVKKLKEINIDFITLDLEGFRSGSMNYDIK